MAPSPQSEPRLATGDAERLLDIADASVVHGLLGQPPTAPPASQLSPALRRPDGVFVTLMVAGELNGCIGNMEGREALGHGTARNAWSAAFADPRLPALRPSDYEQLLIEVSVLSPLAPIPAASRADLIAELRPHVDGLVIAAGRRQALFLPAVWEQLPDPDAFLGHLQRKAGLPPDFWPHEMTAFRFTAERFARPAGAGGEPVRAA